MRWPSPSPDATRAAGRCLAAVVGEGCVIALFGPLGAGKTAFVKGLADGLGVDPLQVASPSFVIAAEYPASRGRRLAHVDCYRLDGAAALDHAGFQDLLGPDSVVAVEWADRALGALPADRLEIRIDRSRDEAAQTQRVLHAKGSGPASREILARWSDALTGDQWP
ncbi:MAG: tRNA (adenosine(37)-N6)-threonylcarbamoyltransferase complex ATPase subunit type 1 TsaE [Myxococcota bacterium]|nr:tRNA (adenosine(37)-N6)-threonylcarbamoyltransferase complex ATPase subunit type 1 TsaE [bacterium]MDP6073643.1 tRNA (adenosine(37)-N6)-threonylcarbamoyltransferase complex ATPase subunit type 1 TsaE [Myxococcota bacterium]MDP6244862.1 tRNA (adenosine(37)-N6)-threonylcarbamoyltransferase complex ATPase subunit type 1 TsaE [Myxococcota bacterium]MDP7074183.1 tRNA (adenosine(37)-N6)-threonylcarbamoyltransferase complex ATPase subunit type 1 TsaE [Myxococcota bacterium]MDP7299810.1 tRNA (adenos